MGGGEKRCRMAKGWMLEVWCRKWRTGQRDNEAGVGGGSIGSAEGWGKIRARAHVDLPGESEEGLLCDNPCVIRNQRPRDPRFFHQGLNSESAGWA